MIRCLLLVTILFFHSSSSSQVAVAVFTDPGKDTLTRMVNVLNQQLNRSLPVKIETRNQLNFKGNGILLSDEPSKWKTYASGLKGMGPEAVVIKNTSKGVAIIGNSQMAVQHGIFLYLEKLGFRYFFPHPDWHIIPSVSNLYPVINYKGQPSFDHRRIWYAYGAGSKSAQENYDLWYMANRLGGSLEAIVGHAYDDIVYRNQEAFKQHPEWLYPAPAKGTLPSGNPKFNLASKELTRFVIADVLERLRKAKASNKPIKMISMSPSDGLGTCNTTACRQLGTITDRVYSLVNEVAKAVRKQYPGTWVSGMSYSEYSPPPTKKLEPNTFVSIATAFNYSKYSTDQLITLWSRKAGRVGIYDYLGLYVWDFDMPGQGQASRIKELIAKLKKYHKLGARGYDAETTPGAINKGLGHFITSRLLWNITADAGSLKKEFFQQSFGKASGLMEALWNQWESYPYTSVRESDLAEWIDMVEQAGIIEKNRLVQNRLVHIKVYLHYLHLYNRYRNSNAEADLVSLLTYAYNTMDWGAFSGYPALWVLGNASTTVTGLKFGDPKAKYKKDNPQFKNYEYIDRLVASDRKQLQKKDRVKDFDLTDQLTKAVAVPAIFKDKSVQHNKGTTAFTGPHNYIIEIKAPGHRNYIEIAAGFVTGGGSEKPVALSLFKYAGSVETSQSPVLQFNYSGKMDTQQVSLKRLPAGYYLLKVNDPQKKYTIDFSPSLSYAVIVNANNRMNAYTRYMSFYVPAGVEKFRVFKDIAVILTSPKGRKIDLSKNGTGESDITVLGGEQGLWMINFLSGKFHIEGIPPFMAMDPGQMLIPKK